MSALVADAVEPQSGGLGGRHTAEPNGPLVQSVGIAFRLAYIATFVLALAWLASNIRQVPADSTAVVTRFGRIVAVQGAGLLLALPRPIDDIALLPGPDRQLGLVVAPLPRAAGLDSTYTGSVALRDAARAAATAALQPRPAAVAPASGAAGSYLTGDGGVVLLDATLTYRVSDPAAYLLAQSHVEAALNRAFRAAAVTVSAGHPLDDFLVVDQTRAANGRSAANARLRDQLLAAIDARLQDLAVHGGSLGITVTRLDLTAALPPAAKLAFDSVLTASQVADQALANARTDATRRLQDADRERDRLLNVARANAAERVTAARTHTASVSALAAKITPETRGNLLDQVYRERLGAIIGQVGQVTAVDARGGARLILPGGKP